MSYAMRQERVLQVLLVLIGSFFVAGIYPLLTSLPQHPQSDYGDHMMLAVYFVLGVFLLLAVRRPAAPGGPVGERLPPAWTQ